MKVIEKRKEIKCLFIQNNYLISCLISESPRTKYVSDFPFNCNRDKKKRTIKISLIN